MEKKENTSPWLVLLLLWGVVLFFTLFGAPVVRDELKWQWLEGPSSGLAKVADAIGLGHVKSGVEAIRRACA